METQSRRLHQGHARRTRSRMRSCALRALRLLHGDLPDLSAAGRRARRPARTHLPDQADARRRRGHRKHAAAPRPLPHLPQLRNDLSVRRALWPAGSTSGATSSSKKSSVRRGRAHARWLLRKGLTHRGLVRRWRLPPAASRGRCCRARSPPEFPASRAPNRWPEPRHARRMLVARGLRAARAGAVDRCCARSRARPDRHLAGPCRGIRLLRRHQRSSGRARRSARLCPPPTSMPGGRMSSRAPRRLVVSASGCGVVVKDYGYLLRDDRGVRRQGAARRRARARSRRSHRRRMEALRAAWWRWITVPSASRSTRRARCSTGSNWSAMSRRSSKRSGLN